MDLNRSQVNRAVECHEKRTLESHLSGGFSIHTYIVTHDMVQQKNLKRKSCHDVSESRHMVLEGSSNADP